MGKLQEKQPVSWPEVEEEVTRTLAVCIFLACAMTLCAPLLVRAEEQPCRAVADTVVCQRAGFDTLVNKLLDARKERDVCVLRSEVSTADAGVLKSKLNLAVSERDKALADLAVVKAKPVPYGRRIGAVGLGFLSGMALAAAPLPQSESVSVGLLGAAFTAAAGALALVVLE